ncbi:DsbA family protein [Pedococcus cremeus]|uniref:DsbA family protein n=1 Tax=Pedococcus cremeus TaxID=587636 RepID=UPI0015A5013C|nr:DsbA family protein [Pedococcus cremeus]
MTHTATSHHSEPSNHTSGYTAPSSHRDRGQSPSLSSWCAHDSRSLHRGASSAEPWRLRLGSAFRATGAVAHQSERPLLVYLHDPYCPWSYGYLPSVRTLLGHIGHEADLEVVNIGLFHGESVAAAATPMEAVRRSTGAKFGPGYELTLHDAALSLDSRLAAAAVIGLTSAAPRRELEVLEALQRAFFWDGRSLSDPSTVRDVADELGLDGPAVELFAGSSRAAELADEDIRLAHDLGARRGPMLLVSHGHQLDELEGPGTSGEQLLDEYQSVLASR